MEAISARFSKTQSLALSGLFIAFFAIGSWISIPLGLVPFTLQIFVLALALLVLSPKQNFLTVLIYEALGAIGLPFFAGMKGGPGVLIGPTGGFLLGFLLCALINFALFSFLAHTSFAMSGITNGSTHTVTAATTPTFTRAQY